jgi:hypothetical protein
LFSRGVSPSGLPLLAVGSPEVSLSRRLRGGHGRPEERPPASCEPSSHDAKPAGAMDGPAGVKLVVGMLDGGPVFVEVEVWAVVEVVAFEAVGNDLFPALGSVDCHCEC